MFEPIRCDTLGCEAPATDAIVYRHRYGRVRHTLNVCADDAQPGAALLRMLGCRVFGLTDPERVVA